MKTIIMDSVRLQKTFKGKAIYKPSGKAGEYAEWACNFYAGCSNGCEYCYLTKGWSAKTYEHRYPKLKAHFKNEAHALEVFEKELELNLPELQKHGLFFSFTTDPMLRETIYLTLMSIGLAVGRNIPVKILTKRADFMGFSVFQPLLRLEYKHLIAFGFTLTGHDELEPNASTNAERVEAMRKLRKAGFKTFASIEPIIDIDSSLDMIEQTLGFCELFKIGLLSGKKYDKNELQSLIGTVCSYTHHSGSKVYFKDSLLKQAGINRADLPNNCVNSNYNIFNTNT